MSSDRERDTSLSAQFTILISNDLYGSETVSAFDKAKCFTIPLIGTLHAITDYLLDEKLTLSENRKPTLILRSKYTTEIPVFTGGLVDLFA